MAAVNFKKVIQELVVPELQVIRTDVATIKIEIKRLDEKIDGVKEDVRNLREEVRNLRGEFQMAIDMHERIAAIETKLALH